tara:strand:+ start:15131 stop:16117 length:987 start_codon:yes stop_codon:yes gene_type:complete
MIKNFLDLVIKRNASDLHLSSSNIPTIRINGKLIKIGEEKLEPNFIKEVIKKILPKHKFQFFKEGNETDYSFYHNKHSRFRVNCFNNIKGPSISFRYVNNKILSLEEIKAPQIFHDLCHLTNGLVIISGATGSGKSTTLAAMINYINNQQAKHIITIEDPIEYIHHSNNSLINHIEVGKNTKSFAGSLRACLRQDPDIILVGEIRDLETMHLALTAAETGHLVFATLHTNSSYHAINRIIDIFPESDKNTIRSMLSMSLKAIICQQLVTTKNNSRCAAFEIMIANSAVKNLIRTNNIHNINSAIETGSQIGMTSMESYLKKLKEENII